mmetsp:Transcript_19176/g.41529  ORF Transcript_19176/g.41529 Transcript_19176/m.41529 type:complete len:125 (+) Transcript_19176:881-1255(+)
MVVHVANSPMKMNGHSSNANVGANNDKYPDFPFSHSNQSKLGFQSESRPTNINTNKAQHFLFEADEPIISHSSECSSLLGGLRTLRSADGASGQRKMGGAIAAASATNERLHQYGYCQPPSQNA